MKQAMKQLKRGKHWKATLISRKGNPAAARVSWRLHSIINLIYWRMHRMGGLHKFRRILGNFETITKSQS